MRKPSPATVIALIALFVALGGPAQAAKLINGKKIKKNTITTKQIKNRTITSGDISSRTLRSLKAKSKSVSSAQIIDGSVSLADMAFGSVTGNQVVDRSLTGIDVAPDSIGAGELATDSVGNAEIADDAVTNREIKTSAVTKGSIKGSSIGTGEVIDRDLTGVDIAKASGTLPVTTVTLAAQACATRDFTAPDYSIPAGAVAGTVVAVSAPGDGVVATARAVSPDTIRLQLCNPTLSSGVNANGDYRFLAIAP